MLFNSFEFFVFLPVVFAVYWALPRRAKNLFLVAASYLFYGWWDARFISLIVVSTVADYLIARRLQRTAAEGRRRALLFTSLAVNLGILGFFKYFGFFVDSFRDLATGLGFEVAGPTLDIVLPVGISFYTFQTISYTFDVYRHRIDAERDFVAFAAYVAFFPQLVAGPIERARHLLPQITAERRFPGLEQMWSGGWLILLGLFKKIVLADGLAGIVQERFADPAGHGALSLLLGMYAFAIQIYGDFSGYSSIARGVARLFGIELMRNFEQPYLSVNITQFWRTWHISLSTWLHDYLYVPLGGNRGGRFATYRNLLLTMLLGGLWHGAAWTFVAWGGLHGLLLAGHRAFGAYERRGRPEAPRWRDLGRILVTFHAVSVLWVFFRAETIGGAFDYLAGLARIADLAVPGEYPDAANAALVLLFVLATALIDWVDRNRYRYLPVETWSPTRLGVAAGLMLAALLVWGGGQPEPFIYFQF